MFVVHFRFLTPLGQFRSHLLASFFMIKYSSKVIEMLINNDKYVEFLKVCKKLNTELQIIPVLFGSLGLEVLCRENFNADDIDVLVPNKYLDSFWDDFKKLIEENEYVFIDLHEHEFIKGNIKLAFAAEESLVDFADVDYHNLNIINDEGSKYKLLNSQEYLRVYKKSYKDSYRRDKNNGKDKDKIEFLEVFISNQSI